MKIDVKKVVRNYIADRKIVILGFGKEGRSTYRFLRKYFTDLPLVIADSNTAIECDSEIADDENVRCILGENYLKNISHCELVFKSPGICFVDYEIPSHQSITSQTDLFLKLYSDQCIGVTGTKGKSTTVSLLKHVLSHFYNNVMLIGNIGIPALDVVGEMRSDSIVVFEMSSHQLEFVNHSPHISILLNLYQEHLDHYRDYRAYRYAKWNIAKYQSENDYLLYCSEEKQVCEDIESQQVRLCKLKYGFNSCDDLFLSKDNKIISQKSGEFFFEKDNFPLIGNHNLLNSLSVFLVCEILNLPLKKVLEVAMTFKSLSHRLEYVDRVKEIDFYNDSIATVPQATIKALESIKNVKTLILGGFDRGVDYQVLYDFLMDFDSLNILLVGDVGRRIEEQLKIREYKGLLIWVNDFDSIVLRAIEHTPPGSACLLSPAAASYDRFKNFEERGRRFKELVRLQK